MPLHIVFEHAHVAGHGAHDHGHHHGSANAAPTEDSVGHSHSEDAEGAHAHGISDHVNRVQRRGEHQAPLVAAPVDTIAAAPVLAHRVAGFPEPASPPLLPARETDPLRGPPVSGRI
ncbi:MAG: hypothetical protein HYV27_01395 [Candidatus Hydrogenedentes bacterium]|nr:hypothetical protein [Candidatus Hydrogenedentota bacterium]